MNEILDIIEKDGKCKIVILEGEGSVFCSGLDLTEISDVLFGGTISGYIDRYTIEFNGILNRLISMPKVVVSNVSGLAMGGGLGIISASDLIIASYKSEFSLPEALWGLMPAIVIPFLIRRIGFHNTYKMALTTMSVTADEALRIGLIDELSDNFEESIRKYSNRISRIDADTMGSMKQYFRQFDGIDTNTEYYAANELKKMLNSPKVIDNIQKFTLFKKLPWEIRN